MERHFDIAIVGGGIAGASLAYFLSPYRSVVVLERESAAGYHATGRSAAEFSRRFHDDIVAKLTRSSYTFFSQPPDNFSEVALLKPRGNLIIANAEKAGRLAQVFAEEQAESLPNPVERLSVEQAIDKVPFLDPNYIADAFYDPDCWDIEVENALQGYLKGAKNFEAKMYTNAEITGAKYQASMWQLTSSLGEIHASVLVNAGGAWADSIAQLSGVAPLSLTPYRRTVISVKVPQYELHDMPEVNEVDEDFYFKPDAGQLMVSPADETPVDPHDAWPEEMDIAYAAHYLSECTTLEFDHIAHSWAGLRTFAPDRVPVVGYSSQVPGFFWLAGQGGFGIQTSPALGRLASELIQHKPVPDELSILGLTEAVFSPARFGG